MTRDEVLKRLRSLHSGDEEVDHLDADGALLEYINDPEISQAFNEIPKWYA